MESIFRNLSGPPRLGIGKDKISEPLLDKDERSSQDDNHSKTRESSGSCKDTSFELEGGENVDQDVDSEKQGNLLRKSMIVQTEHHLTQFKEFYVFEPRGFKQRFKGCRQNMFEILMIMAIVILALMMPSVVACFFLLISHLILWTATHKADIRLSRGKIMLVCCMTLLVVFMAFKLYFILKLGSQTFLNQKDYLNAVHKY
jgi:hypothetical protein